MAITKIQVGVKRLIALAKYENVTYSCEVEATVAEHESPLAVYEDCLAFCQDKIMSEMERMERGENPKRNIKVENDDYIPDFKPV